MLVKTKKINLKTTNQKHIKMSDIVNSGIVDTKSKDDRLKSFIESIEGLEEEALLYINDPSLDFSTICDWFNCNVLPSNAKLLTLEPAPACIFALPCGNIFRDSGIIIYLR